MRRILGNAYGMSCCGVACPIDLSAGGCVRVTDGRYVRTIPHGVFSTVRMSGKAGTIAGRVSLRRN